MASTKLRTEPASRSRSRSVCHLEDKPSGFPRGARTSRRTGHRKRCDGTRCVSRPGVVDSAAGPPRTGHGASWPRGRGARPSVGVGGVGGGCDAGASAALADGGARVTARRARLPPPSRCLGRRRGTVRAPRSARWARVGPSGALQDAGSSPRTPVRNPQVHRPGEGLVDPRGRRPGWARPARRRHATASRVRTPETLLTCAAHAQSAGPGGLQDGCEGPSHPGPGGPSGGRHLRAPAGGQGAVGTAVRNCRRQRVKRRGWFIPRTATGFPSRS